jgi:DNA invertase Pin-like site-specific DNA recombinase
MRQTRAKNECLWYDWIMKPKRIVLYARVSTKDKGQDTRNQLAQLRDFCDRQGWTVAREYIDNASAKTADRAKFKEMMAAASRRDFDLVLFWSLDRFSREGVLETLQHLQRLTSYAVGWKSFTEQYLDSCGVFRDAVLSILATIAKQERIRLSERTVAGLERARKQGRIGGRPRVITDRTRIADLRAAGKSLGEIAAEMDLSKTTVARIAREAAAA